MGLNPPATNSSVYLYYIFRMGGYPKTRAMVLVHYSYQGTRCNANPEQYPESTAPARDGNSTAKGHNISFPFKDLVQGRATVPRALPELWGKSHIQAEAKVTIFRLNIPKHT